MVNKEEEEFDHLENADLRRRIGPFLADIVIPIAAIIFWCWVYYAFLKN